MTAVDFPGADLLPGWRRDLVAKIIAERGSRVVPPVTCHPWCEYEDGHAGQFHTDDVWCGTRIREIPTVAYPAVEVRPGAWEQERVWALGRAWHHGRQSIVEICLSDQGGLQITPAEARQLAAAIVEVCDEMEAER